jgi:hypothetical protein
MDDGVSIGSGTAVEDSACATGVVTGIAGSGGGTGVAS